ncbi:MAG: hypothetical protein JW827_10480 [Spirochaetes bacterium]|nr:hypothetical protein [Spirochaetota bacterium]
MKCSCGSNCGSSLNYKILCSQCKVQGKPVPAQVVKNFIKTEFQKKIKSKEYLLCLNPDCAVAYFSRDGSELYTINDIRKPIWFKKGASPKIACYCNSITDDQVREAVVKHGLTSWKSIVLHYRKKAFCLCERINPAGECCTEQFYDIINKALRSIGKRSVGIPASCCG